MPLPLFLGLAAAAIAGANIVKQANVSQTASDAKQQAEAQYSIEKKVRPVTKELSEFQQKMLDFLFKNAFSEYDKGLKPPLSEDWPFLNLNPKSVHAANQYTFFSWNEYSFFTEKVICYYHKNKAIHDFLFYDNINSFNLSTGIVDYGKEHQKRSIAHWPKFEQQFIAQICHIRKAESETDSSTLEFCFNHCDDFKKELCYKKTNKIRSTFATLCKSKSYVLQQLIDNITIVKMENRKLVLQFWVYIPSNYVSKPRSSSEDVQEEYENKVTRLEDRIQELEAIAEEAPAILIKETADIIEVFQQAILSLYGVRFEKENITFLKEPDITYGKPSLLEKVDMTIDKMDDKANAVMGYLHEQTDKHR